MALADTAKLIASLELKDNLTAGAAKVAKSVGMLETQFGGLGKSLGHAQTQIGGLLSGPLGLIGLGGGLFGIEQLISGSLSKTNDLAEAIEKLTGITGLSAESASTFIAVFSRFNLDSETTTTSLGFLEKALGNITKTPATEKSFWDEFGFSLRDANGNVKDAQTVFENLADYWTTDSIPASQKAALAAKLLGRGYVDLVPALNEGSSGLKDIEQTARDLGLVMNEQNLTTLKAYHESMEKMGMAVGGLQLAIGLGLAPAMTDFTDDATNWIKNGGAKEVAKWFKEGADVARTLGGVITDDVVPVFGMIADAWGKVPDDLKKLLIGGIVAQKASSWLFGGGGALGALGDLLKAGGKVTVQTLTDTVGVQKVFVVNPGFGGSGPSIPPGPGGGPEIPPVVSGGLPFVGPLATTATTLGVLSAIVTPIVAALDLKYIAEGGQVRSRSSMGLGGFKDYDPLSAALSKDTAAVDAHAALMSQTTLQLSHDTSGVDTHATISAQQAIQAFFNQKPTVTVAGWDDLITHRDDSAKDLHEAARDLRDSRPPAPNVEVIINFSARDVTTTQTHRTWYGGMVPD